MVVYFLRHAEAEPDAGTDFDRKLTTKGLEQAEKMAKFILRNGLQPELIISSPVVRARQTAKIISQKLGDADLVVEDWLACGMSPESCLEELRAYEQKASVMVVGHEPDFGYAIAHLIGLANADAINVRKASLTAIEIETLQPGHGRLEFFTPVRIV